MQRKQDREKGAPMSSAANTVQKILTKVHTSIYRATGGKVAGRVFKSPVLLLTTTGRKSGRERTSPLLYFEDGENLVLVASNGGGAPPPPRWRPPHRKPPA